MSVLGYDVTSCLVPCSFWSLAFWCHGGFGPWGGGGGGVDGVWPILKRMTDTCKNITFPQLCLREINIAYVDVI